MRKIALPAFAAVAMGFGTATPATACSADTPYLGAICYMVTQYCPEGYIQANGQLLTVTENQALFSLVGATFGGDGRNNFAVPDLRGRAPIGWGSGLGLTRVAYGQYVGQESVRLSAAQMAPHDHPATFMGTGGGSGSQTVTVGPIAGSGLTLSGLTVTATPTSLTATTSGEVQIAAAAPVTGSTAQPTAGAVFAKPPAGAINIYNPGAAADTAIGGTQTFSGPVTGTIATSVSGGTISGTPTIPQFSFDVPTGGITGGDVTVGDNIQPQQQALTPVRDPAVGLTACIATVGIYPVRPQ